jgi:hypothetical protein
MINLEEVEFMRGNDAMAFKVRTESDLLKCLRILNLRMELTEDEKKYYLNLKKGYEGEVKFDLITDKFQSNCLILNDLLLKVDNTTSQIDTSIIFQDTLHLFEIKNFEGDFSYQSDKLQTVKGKDYKNPLHQINRSTILLNQLLQSHKINFNIVAHVVFINPEFTLFQAPPNLPFIYPTQLNRFFKKYHTKPSRLNTFHMQLAEKLVSLHQTESPYALLPKYEYHQLKKGITCRVCQSFLIDALGKNVVCSECGCQESVEFAVLRSVEEIKILFPDRKITTNIIYEWCAIVPCKKRISRILGRNFKVTGVHQWAFFE